ncbi:MAG: nucleotidyltransferase domain-containing protein [Candidatus Moraniibacteriota bacterium]
MLEEKYIAKIKELFSHQLEKGERVFVFGSSVEGTKFNDVDLAIVSERKEIDKTISKIKDALDESSLPYRFDVININNTKDPFRERVMGGPKIWII